MNSNASDCLAEFEGHGVSFRYPGFWELNEERDGTDVVLTVSTDDSCFWVLRLLADCPRADEVVRQCVQALEEDSDDLEIVEHQGRLAEMPACCREVTFSCFELLNSAGFRSVRMSDATLLVWWQCTDHEAEDVRPLFEQMTQSVRMTSLKDE